MVYSFQQVREDLAHHTKRITLHQLWFEMAGKHSLGYHLKHIAGSVDRLVTYLCGEQLSERQLQFLKDEHTPDATLAELLAMVESSLRGAEQRLLDVKAEILFDVRTVGRQSLPTTVVGLMVHVCEHTQRHLGQAIVLAKMLRDS
jgi:uncharacterized damage-inducible protein DinB